MAYGEIVQIKQDRIIPVFLCQIIKTSCPSMVVTGSAGLGSNSSGSGTQSHRSLGTQSGKTRQTSVLGGQTSVLGGQTSVLGGQTIVTEKGSTISHSVYLSGEMNNDSNCEAGII